ncbi:PEP-CTERM protein-sorting domain-containing protein [Lentzea xinjiangensis]|uniref:PEP-CTERM protein-sorting domain-containing protein n=1 Tax=Lentzea xinjiangensis TaxID=402600 RepID=A0A1H9RU24_9PSEU|nr:hypothetical protein [Lentzea xinjiangensis]SER76302.1 PEP-CTERM protein-sorting domain-containing protein [Lentzea xinjiangensis]
MPDELPPGRSLVKAKVIAALVVLAFLVGLLFVAINRGPNDAYIALVALTIAGLVLALLVAWYRRKRQRRSRDRPSDVDGSGGEWQGRVI